MPATEMKVDKPRLSAEDWAMAALDVIAEQGLAAVAVEPLARRLGVTKGSFYWHFPSREALLVAALERWERTEQETVFGQLEAVSDPRARLRDLFRLVAPDPRPPGGGPCPAGSHTICARAPSPASAQGPSTPGWSSRCWSGCRSGAWTTSP